MKKKNLKIVVLSGILSAAFSVTAFAGSWQLNSTGWWWQNDDGTWPADCWEWLDGNSDGTAECYYFDGNGYMLADTTTPDGYTVNADGKWTENGVIQTRTLSDTAQANNAAAYEALLWLMGVDMNSDPQTDYYAAQLYGNDEWFDLYDSTGTTRYTRANKPEWVQYEENGTTCLITGEIFESATGPAIKVYDVQPESGQTSTEAAPDVSGVYVGDGLTCEITNEGGGSFWCELSGLEKDYLPAYAGNGVFEFPGYIRYTFNGNNLTVEYTGTGEVYNLVKQ